jgi:hypothetical protein
MFRTELYLQTHNTTAQEIKWNALGLSGSFQNTYQLIIYHDIIYLNKVNDLDREHFLLSEL